MNKFTLAALLGTTSANWMPDVRHANSVNPFVGKTIFANPLFTSEVQGAEKKFPGEAPLMKSTERIGAANWIDSMAKIDSLEPILQKARDAKEVPMFVIYDLPNRDCDALASNGEILCKDSSCSEGLETYQT
jgi:cellulose 1,4-beta-cellobiosidase